MNEEYSFESSLSIHFPLDTIHAYKELVMPTTTSMPTTNIFNYYLNHFCLDVYITKETHL